MLLSWRRCATIVMAIGQVSGLAVSYPSRNASMPNLLLSRQSIEDFDPDDLSYIQKLDAIGDSYSAGIGAGNRLGSVLNALDPNSDWACSRYDQSYPSFVDGDARLGNRATRNFQFKSCSGATSSEVIEHQIPRLDGNQDVILLSAGQLAESARLIDSDTFARNLDKVIAAAQSKLSLKYAKFFATDMSSECDDVTWSTWLNELYNKFALEKAYLTKGRRQKMNDLVNKVNKKLAEAVERAGNSVKFINYDKYVGYYGGRYCETGVDESTSEAKTRQVLRSKTGLMFYELNTWDPFGSSPWKRSNDDALQGTFDGEQDIMAQVTLLLEPDAELAHQDRVEGDASAASVSASSKNDNFTIAASEIQIPSFLPDG
ncbi:kinetoplastid membrane protein 11 [Colletotrichum eremochloae]|nr:kinetoplastid membrane protein 11 [Colletotrichum eremochloae]